MSNNNNNNNLEPKSSDNYGVEEYITSPPNNKDSNKDGSGNLSRSPSISSLSRSSSMLFGEDDGSGNDITSPFIFAQSLTSVCLDPMSPISTEWSSSDLQIPQTNSSSTSPINSSHNNSNNSPNLNLNLNNNNNITIQSFSKYIEKIKPMYDIFIENKYKELIPTNKKTQEEITSLDNIPSFFFKKNMTITEVLNYADKYPSPVLFQKLENYYAIVEESIVGHVRDKSLSFFSAMSDLKQFRSQLISLSNHIKGSDDILNDIENNVIHGLNISKLHLQKNRINSTLELISLVSEVKQAQPALQLLLSKGDYMGALELIYRTQSAISTDLYYISSLKNISPQLLEMINLIEKMSLNDFIRISINDDLLFGNSVGNGSSILDENINNYLSPLILVLLKVGRIQEALEEFRDSSIESIKQLFKNTVANITYQLLDSGGSSHHKTPTDLFNSQNFNWNDCKSKLLKLSSNDSLPLFKAVDQSFRKKFIILSKILELIINIVNSNSQNSQNSQNEILYETVVNTCNTVAYSIIETMQERISSLMKVRGDINAKLALPDFVLLYNQVESFLKFTESNTLSKRKPPILRSSLLAQLKMFLDVLHKNRLSSLSLLLENEDWIQVKVVSEFQNIVNKIVKQSTDGGGDGDGDDQQQQQQQVQQAKQEEEIADEIYINSEPFKVVNTSLMLLKFLNDYLCCCEQLPTIVIDSLPKIIELLNTFNQTTYHLVLMAGARQTMKLKTITSKHLGYASQSLSFQIKLIPYIKVIVSRSLSNKQLSLLNGLDKLLQDFATHRQEIFNKFSVIIKERSTYHLKVLGSIDLRDDTLPIPTPPISALSKDITTLHKLLASILPPDQLFKVFTNIYFMFNTLFIDHLSKFDLSHKLSKRRIHNDVLHLLNSIRNLPNAGDPGNDIEDYLNQNFPM